MPIDRTILDKFGTAIGDLYGLVPQADRKYADDYVTILQHCKSVMAENIDALQKIEAALFHNGRNTEIQMGRIKEIETNGTNDEREVWSDPLDHDHSMNG